MELINIISYSLLILIATLVVFLVISYIFSAFKKKNRRQVITNYNPAPVFASSNSSIADGLNIRRESQRIVKKEVVPVNYEYDNYSEEFVSNDRRRKEPEFRQAFDRYSVVNNNVYVEERRNNYPNFDYDDFSTNDFSTIYENEDTGTYYNIRIGA